MHRRVKILLASIYPIALTALFLGCIMQASIKVPVDASTTKKVGEVPRNLKGDGSKSLLRLTGEMAKSCTTREIGDGVFYHRFLFRDMVAHAVSLSLNNARFVVKPIVAETRATTSSLTINSEALAGINGGYFNLTDGVSASYVVVDGKQVLDPTENQALVDNPRLKPFLAQIFDRSELRIYGSIDTEATNFKGQVTPHGSPCYKEMKLISSIQGGPALLPSITSEKGAFVRREKNGKATDSIGTNRKAARTAVGLTGDGGIVLLVVEGSRGKEFSAGATLKELAQLLKEIGCVEALNLDGGTSTTMVVKDPSGQVLTPGSRRGRALDKGYSLLFANEIERKVKSVLAVMPRK